MTTTEILRDAGKNGGTAKQHRWSQTDQDVVRLYYDGHSESVRQIAGMLGVSYFGVKGQIARLGLQKSCLTRWTTQEEERLSNLIGQYAPVTIAKMMHRSINSVVVKSQRLNLKRRYRDGWYTKTEACEMLGVDHHKVQHWIDRGWLKASYHIGIQPSNLGRAMWHINESDLADFIKGHCSELQGRNIDLFGVLTCLNISWSHNQ